MGNRPGREGEFEGGEEGAADPQAQGQGENGAAVGTPGDAAAAAAAGGEGGGSDPEDPDETIQIDKKYRVATGRKVSVDDFDLLKVLGKGSFGKVMLVRKVEGADAGQLYALKTLKKEVLLKQNQIAHTRTERSVLQTVDHPFIVTLRYAFQTREKLYLVTDYAPGGELFYWLKRDRVFSQARVRMYAAELILALEHLHQNDVVYRDLKPENILLDADGHIKLTDFGLSKEAVTGFGPDGGTKTFCGTPEYLAPEILENKGHGKAVDWWSLGTLLYEMCAGLPPFYDQNMEAMYEKIMTAELQFPRHFLPETRSLLEGMLQRDVERRLGYNGAEEIKRHPFFAEVDWDHVAACRYKPMFAPPLADDAEARNFEAEFTRETPVDSVPSGAALSQTMADRAHFPDFTYQQESAMGGVGGSAHERGIGSLPPQAIDGSSLDG